MTGLVEPVTLTGDRWVALEPLGRQHVPEIEDSARRTGVHRETTLLMLRHAFETWVVSRSSSARISSTPKAVRRSNVSVAHSTASCAVTNCCLTAPAATP